nr:heme-binding Shp domain-containing protein [uncultured Peptoniphilus sp.]
MKKIVILFMAIFLLMMPGLCFANGPYIVDMRASYRHPVTGVIEDSGKNEGIGQGMAEGVLHPQALYEEIGGKRYLTLRLHMMDNISKVSIGVQRKGDSGFSAVSYENTQGDGEWKDFRIQLPAKECVIRLSLFVDAMGRDVVFYGDMGKMTAGNTDFVSSAKSAPAQTKGTAQKAPPAKSSHSPKPKVDGAAPTQGASMAPVATPSSGSSSTNVSSDTPIDDHNTNGVTHGGVSGLDDTESDIGYEHGLLTEDSPEIQEMEKGEKGKDEQQEAPKKKAPWGPATRIMFASFMAVIVFLTCASLTAGAVFYFLAKKKRMLNELREEDEDEDFSFEDF